MSVVAAMLVAFVDALEADPDLAARTRHVLGIGADPVDMRIPLADVKAHGAPSVKWASARGIVRGPRGGRYVPASALAVELEAATIARRKSAPEANATKTIVHDAQAAVVNLAARRASKRTG